MFQSSFPKIIFIFLEIAKNAFFNIGFMAKKYHAINPCGTSSPSNVAVGLFPAIPLIQVLPYVFNLFNIRI